MHRASNSSSQHTAPSRIWKLARSLGLASSGIRFSLSSTTIPFFILDFEDTSSAKKHLYHSCQCPLYCPDLPSSVIFFGEFDDPYRDAIATWGSLDGGIAISIDCTCLYLKRYHRIDWSNSSPWHMSVAYYEKDFSVVPLSWTIMILSPLLAMSDSSLRHRWPTFRRLLPSRFYSINISVSWPAYMCYAWVLDYMRKTAPALNSTSRIHRKPETNIYNEVQERSH